MILSASSSISFSALPIISATSGACLSISRIFSSPSNNLTAKNRFCASGTPVSLPSISLKIPSTSGANSGDFGTALLSCAIFTAFSAASLTPSPLSAEIAITSQPRLFSNCPMSIRSPDLSTASIIFTAITTGTPSSISCVLR